VVLAVAFASAKEGFWNGPSLDSQTSTLWSLFVMFKLQTGFSLFSDWATQAMSSYQGWKLANCFVVFPFDCKDLKYISGDISVGHLICSFMNT
jgi:hypothetical protein